VTPKELSNGKSQYRSQNRTHHTMGYPFKQEARPSAVDARLRWLHEQLEKDPKKLQHLVFKILDLRIIDLTPGSFKYEYTVQRTSGKKAGEFQFCVMAVFEDDEGQKLELQIWEPFAKVIGMTAEAYEELQEEQKRDAFENIDSATRYNLKVKVTDGEFKLTNLGIAPGVGDTHGQDNDKNDMVPRAKKAKKSC